MKLIFKYLISLYILLNTVIIPVFADITPIEQREVLYYRDFTINDYIILSGITIILLIVGKNVLKEIRSRAAQKDQS